MVGSWGYWNSVGTNASGNPTAAADAINSTTAANGFLISDIDSANHWNGNSGSSSGSTYHYIESYFTTSAIDLTGWPNVSLEFEYNFRFNNSVDLVVSVSNDSVNWTDYNIQGTATNNQESADPEYLNLNISGIAGNQDSVYVKIGWNARVYYWMIDDMKIVETPDHLMKIRDETFGGWWVGYQSSGDLGIDYTFNPLNQVLSNPYRFEAIVSNNGALDQHNVVMNIDVQTGGSSTFSTTSTPMTLNVMATDTLIAPTFSPSTYGYHKINFSASSDSFPTTDTISRGTIVTDTVYGIDFDWDSDGSNAGSGEDLGRPCGGQSLGNAFDIYADDTATSISFHVNDQSVVGAELYVKLYEIDPFVTPYSPIYLEESDIYVLTQNDLDSWVTLKLADPVNVFAGLTYVAVVEGTANPVDTSLISRTSKHNTLSFIQDNGCNIGSGGFGYWYSTSTRSFMIRLNLGDLSSSTSINEKIFDGKLLVYPNPSEGTFILEMFNVNSEKYTITVSNVLGKTIYNSTDEINSTFKKEIDLSAFSKGVYLISIENSNSSITKKLIIE
jgi:hypothetical protein